MLRAIAMLPLLLAAACAGLPEAPRSNAADEPALDRQILLTVHQRASAATALRGAPSERYVYRRGYGPTSDVDRVIARLANAHSLRRVRGWPIGSLDVYCVVLEISDDRPLESVLEALRADPDVDIAQPMNTFRALTSGYDDPFVGLQSSMTLLDIESAHSLATGKGVLIAVIDSGVDRNHPDLQASISLRRDLVRGRGDRGVGEVHGTAVAGVIASTANNAVGIVGVAPEANIAALRACWSASDGASDAVCSSFTLAQALEIALQLEPDIINMSLAGPEDPILGRLIDAAVERGIAVIAAEDSGSGSAPFPASHAGVLAAKASVPDSTTPALPAPAVEVLTTTPGREYAFLSGSSLAAAHVSGIVALLLEQRPELGYAEIKAILQASTTVSGGVPSVNACRALQHLGTTPHCQSAAAIVAR